MPISLSMLRPGESQRVAAYLQTRSQVLAAMDEIYKRVEIYSSAQIDPASYKLLGINCRLLELDDDGKHLHPPNSDPSGPVFFEPRGAAWVPPVVTNSEYMKQLKGITDGWGNTKNDRLLRSLHSQASYVFSCVEWMFFQFRRQFYPPEDDRDPPNLRQMSKWLESGEVVPSVVAERFYPAIWGSIRSSPAAVFVPKSLLYPLGAPPHIMISILIAEEPSEELLRLEVMALAAVMITRLEGEESSEYNTIPVMVITFFGRMKVRVLEAHTSQQELVIKKTRLLDFSTNELANKNMNILLGFMAGDLVGDPKGPTIPTYIPKACTKDAMDSESTLTIH
ncbi:hypothetical protein N7457_004084 [Penicillium paradoxum]|uniref:uncharacterized protein n=1 Tax=Penicillium paradoxum TaxID=176176 RepID=UPI0025469572|nr:uncharacterized protein N7457_004084 [Penicillium paradoxum]KAJ5782310.1 hypothetical protein N7457_004084 [Penicillium paradoxum]